MAMENLLYAIIEQISCEHCVLQRELKIVGVERASKSLEGEA